jgi:hypothetical protein
MDPIEKETDNKTMTMKELDAASSHGTNSAYKEPEISIKDIVKNDNQVYFSWYVDGNFYYKVEYQHAFYSFPVPLSDLEAENKPTLLAQDKAIYLMRYIRKAIDNKEFIKQ